MINSLYKNIFLSSSYIKNFICCFRFTTEQNSIKSMQWKLGGFHLKLVSPIEKILLDELE